MELLVISKANLEAVMPAWEQDHRAGKCASYSETRALPAEVVARASADLVWRELQRVTSEPKGA